jgi:hypothetical protein
MERTLPIVSAQTACDVFVSEEKKSKEKNPKTKIHVSCSGCGDRILGGVSGEYPLVPRRQGSARLPERLGDERDARTSGELRR